MSLEDSRWNEYDETIKKEVANYNQKFSAQKFAGKFTNFVPLDWHWVKAMLWTEVQAGPKNNSEQWTKLPMQIGRFAADPAYDVVSGKSNETDKEKTKLVTPDELYQNVQNKSSVVGNLNVRAGIAYLYIAAIDEVDFDDDEIVNPILQTYTIKSGDKLSALISKAVIKTTQTNIIKNTVGLTKENVANLKPGQVISYQEAKPVRNISRWKDWMMAIKNYNSKKPSEKGDPMYLDKINRAYRIIISRVSQ